MLFIKTKRAAISFCCKSHRYKTSKNQNFVSKFNAQKLAVTFLLVILPS